MKAFCINYPWAIALNTMLPNFHPNCQSIWPSIEDATFEIFTVFAIIPQWQKLEMLFLSCVCRFVEDDQHGWIFRSYKSGMGTSQNWYGGEHGCGCRTCVSGLPVSAMVFEKNQWFAGLWKHIWKHSANIRAKYNSPNGNNPIGCSKNAEERWLHRRQSGLASAEKQIQILGRRSKTSFRIKHLHQGEYLCVLF